MNDVTAAIKLDTGAVRKIVTLHGNVVSCAFDWFGISVAKKCTISIESLSITYLITPSRA